MVLREGNKEREYCVQNVSCTEDFFVTNSLVWILLYINVQPDVHVWAWTSLWSVCTDKYPHLGAFWWKDGFLPARPPETVTWKPSKCPWASVALRRVHLAAELISAFLP